MSGKKAAEHPGVLLVHLHSLGEQIGCRFVMGIIDGRKDRSRRAYHGFLAGQEPTDHFFGVWRVVILRDRGKSGELTVGAGRPLTQGTNALGDEIDGDGEFGVLRLEHEVQRLEHRPGHVPVVVVRLQVQRVGIGEQASESAGDGCPFGWVDPDVDVVDVDLLIGHGAPF